jgi:glycosyltransferase involved in cell wall biosynthesis
MTENLVLSIIICTYNRADLLPYSLSALSEQTLDRSLFEIIVVDNNSTDNTRQVVEDFSLQVFPVRYFLEGRQGPNHARNKGIQEAKGKYIACVDDDAKAIPEWAELIITDFETIKPQPLAIGGKIIPWYESQPPSWFSDDFEIREYGKEKGFLSREKAKYGFASGNIALKKDVLREINGFGESFGLINGKFRVGEDTDMFYRIWKKYNDKADTIFWYNPEILVNHWTSSRNWQTDFRMKRGTSAGEALASIENTTFFSKRFFETFVFFLLQPFFLLLNILKFNRPLKNNWLRFLQNISYGAGYLQESLRKK